MAFNGNNSNEEVVGTFKLYTGITKFKVKAICPNKEELGALGFNVEKEAEYITDSDKGKRARIEIVVHSKELDKNFRFSFLLHDTVRTTKDGTKKQLIDAKGDKAWTAGDGSELSWFDPATGRPALDGEEYLNDFLIKWLNIKPKDPARIDNPKKFFEGDFTQLKNLVQQFKNNEFYGMLTVRHADNGKDFQSVYTGFFERGTNDTIYNWNNHITKKEKDGFPLKDSYSFKLQEYTPKEPTNDNKDNEPEIEAEF